MFTYNQETGQIFKAGKGVGYVEKSTGYIRVWVEGKRIYGHRLAWVLFYNQQPKGFIDHLNGIRADNRISNLRLCTSRENNTNRECHRNGKLPGTRCMKKEKKWQARIWDGKSIHLGCFDTEQLAHEAYLNYLAG